MSTTTKSPLEQIQELLRPPKSSLKDIRRDAAERAVEHGGGLLAAVKGGAVGDHLRQLNSYHDRIALDRKIADAALTGMPLEDIRAMVKEHNQQAEDKDEMQVHVQGDQTYNIIGGKELEGILERLQGSKETASTPPAQTPAPTPVVTPQVTEPKAEPMASQEESKTSKLVKVGAAVASGAGLLAGGMYLGSLGKDRTPVVTPQVTRQDILNLNQQILELHKQNIELKEAMDPENWEVVPVPPGG
jgi:hypothetical protein